MIQYSDKLIYPHIYIAYATRYGRQGTKAVEMAKLFKRALPEFHKLLDLPKDVNIRIAGIKSPKIFGRYYDTEKVAEIDPRKSDKHSGLATLAHELVHAEQYYTGRLQKTYVRGRGWESLWNGEVGPRGATYKSYRNSPWEVEAFDRMEPLALQVAVKLGL